MERKTALLALIDHGRKLGDELGRRLSADERAEHGTYETWAPKDGLAHVANWLARDLERLDITDGPLPSFGEGDLEAKNQAIFAEHAGKSWDEVAGFFADTFDEARRRVEEMSAEELERDQEYADGSTRTVWRAIAGHALMHLSPHIAIVYHRRNDPEMAGELEESTARVLLDLDDSPEWVGTTKYNLACHYALIGNAKRAITLLREALAKNPE
ncbi:MAG: ClbS/DfsB family four-helix bundle protein, partial [Spirochaetia bacterium]